MSKTVGILIFKHVSDISLRPNRSKPRFRIEKDESFSSHKMPLGNLMKLFLSQDEADRRLRSLVISSAPLRFDLVLAKDVIEDLCKKDETVRE